jgi:uncharacterized protein
MRFIILLILLVNGFVFANTNPQLISVNGLAERSLDPNIVILNLESFGKAPTAKAAQELQAKEYNRIKIVTEKYKIKKDDFTTENYSINPEYIYDQKTQNNKITGYRVVHQIKITHHKNDEAGALIDALTSNAKIESSGINIQSISWDSDKKSVAESQAMIDAVKSAKDKAENLAKAAGVKIKNVYLISHNSSADMVIRPQMEGRMKSMAFDSSTASTSVSGGQIKVKTEVLMQFEIN